MAVAILRKDLDAAGLRRSASRSKDAGAARRMLALALVLEGRSRTEAAQACGMDRQTLRDWVHRYNEEGLTGLSDRRAQGPTPRLTQAQQAEVAEWVRQGPDLAEHGVVCWRRIDLARAIEQRFGVVLAERTVGTLLRRLGFRRLSVRPVHPQKDPAAEEAHKKTSPIWSVASSPRSNATGLSRYGGRTRLGSANRGP
jgi:transposase